MTEPANTSPTERPGDPSQEVPATTEPPPPNPPLELTNAGKWMIVALFGIPMLIMLLRVPSVPTWEFLYQSATLLNLPERTQEKISHILFIPISAILVVFARLTLGLRILGPFRSILLAVAFDLTGVGAGIIYLLLSVGIILVIRRASTELALPYFGRITVSLSAVSLLMVFAVMAGFTLQLNFLQGIVYFPIVVMCLVADAFAQSIADEGIRTATWRGGMTIVLAIPLSLLTEISELEEFMLGYPEVLIIQIGVIVIVSKFMRWGLLEYLNPKLGPDEEDKKEQS